MVHAAHGTDTGVPPWIEPMLAKPDGGRLATGPGWAYEYKLDGYRAAMRIAPDGTTVLTSRNGIDFTPEFPALAGLLDPDRRGVLASALDGQAAVLDGEIVVYNPDGQVDFGLLQERRGRYRRHRGTDPFMDPVAVRYLAFDLLRLGDQLLLREPYDRRRQLLTSIPMPDPYLVSVVPAITAQDLAADRLTPQKLLDRIASEGHEGLVAKNRAASYSPGKRTDAWLKHPLIQTQEVVVCGWRPGQSRLTGSLGGLLLGAHDPATGELVYIGDVGTGFSEAERRALLERLAPLRRDKPPFAAAPPRQDVLRAQWVEPRLVGEVQFRQFTRGAGRLRHTSWRGVREDRSVDEVTVPTPGRRASSSAASPASDATPAKAAATRSASRGTKVVVQVGERQLTLSNLDKALYPDGYSKAQVIQYYTLIAPVLLPHLTGRPVTFIRFPDGVAGQQFFEKNVSEGAPQWLRTARLPHSGSRGREGDITYPLIDDLPSLVWAANLAALELHVPQWTIGPGPVRRAPDRLVLDLDPGPGVGLVECARVAERLYDVLVADGLTPVAKTSGAKGMQVYAGIRTRIPDRPSQYAKALAERLAVETPKLVTAKMAKALRSGKVFIDWSQNNPAKTTVAPYSLRGREHPTVSTPVTWDEVRSCRHARELMFTADDVVARVERLGDLFNPVAGMRAVLPRR
ncbi:DNA ligase D [Kutzneria sp. 744]|uniref:DNA ligase D n=1 Tax=Kutzneria sp. (strain 744) TaxID=345341 RepID=UPI0003EED226|nr:DNA ligase D [Kutzneria sp. 744]EWM19842.1 DNA ligase (ATP) [Kutzneria sp. 744]